MKLKKYLSFVLALCLVFTMTSPAFAVEGDEQPAGEIVEVVDPAQPEVKDEVEQPSEPEQPTDPETPGEPEQPEQPVDPEQPTDPEQPENPENPETPAQPENPEQLVTPADPEQPVTPVQPEQPVTPVQPEAPEFPDDISGLGKDELEALLGRDDLTDEQREMLESAIESIEKKAADEAFAASLEGLTLEELDALLDDETLTSAQRLLVKKAIAAAKANVDIPDMTDWTVEEIYEFYLTLEGNDAAIQKLFEALTWEQEVELSDYIYEMNGGDGIIDSEAMTDASEPLMPPIDVEMRALSPRRKTAKYNLYNVYSEGNTKENSEGVVADKTVKVNPEGGYTLTLDAFVTGEKTSSSTTKRVPIDAVLVLDVSGSMDENISSSRSSYKRVYSKSGISTGYYNTYYVKTDSGYIRVFYSDRNKTWMDTSGNPYKPKASPLDMSEDRVQFYTQGTVKRIEALRDSVTGFVEALAKDAKENNVQHRVSLIAYSTKVQDTMSCGLELVIDSNGNVNSDLETLINKLKADGATYPNLAMEEAVKVFNDTASVGSNDVVNGNDARQRVTVLFTDGMPGYNASSTSTSCADLTIKYARVLKTSASENVQFNGQNWSDGYTNTSYYQDGYNGYGCGSTVYSVGMISGLNPDAAFDQNDNSRANRYLHYVSSNYMTANKLTYNWNETKPSRTKIDGKDSKYYLSANDADSLNEIFTNIVDSVIGGEAAVALDGSTVVRDVLSGDVVLNYSGEKADAVRVYTVNYGGGNYNNFSENKDDWTDVTDEVNVTFKDDGTIDVSGFNFAANYVWDNADGVEGKTFGGKKLIIEIDIKAKESFGGNNIKTNAENNQSLIFKGDEENGFYYFTSPTIDVELDYKIAVNDKTIYLGNDTDVHDLLAYATGYEPDGDNNKYVDITYTVKNYSGTVIGTYTIEAGETTGTWDDAFDSIELSDCADYTIECVVTADHVTESRGSDYYVHLENNESLKLDKEHNKAKTATIHVLKPAIKAMDIWANYGTEIPLADWAVKRTGSVLEATWADSNNSHDNIPDPEGNAAPAVSLAEVEKKTGDGTLTGLNYMTGADDSDFDITKIKINDKTFDKSHFTVVKAVENEKHDFTVHINHFDLKVTKEVTKGDTNLYGDTFVFTVTDNDGNKEIVEFVLGNGDSKTITGLLCGKSYTVSEDTNWSWRYTATDNGTFTVSGGDHEISNDPVKTCEIKKTVTNELKSDKWLTDEKIKTNTFTSGLDVATGS